MIRFTSFKTNPGETRTLLRTRLKRYLRAPRDLLHLPDTDLIADEAMLRLLQRVIIKHDSDIAEAKRIYAAARLEGEPSFESLVFEGWLQESWGRIWAPRDFHLALKNTQDRKGLQHLISRRHEQHFTVNDAVKSSPDPATVMAEIEAGALQLQHLNCLRPAWVAARLWEERDRKLAPSDQLSYWTDRWLLLSAPNLVIWRTWTSEDAEAFRTAAFGILQNEAGLSDWASSQRLAWRRAALPRGVDPNSYTNYFGRQYDTTVSRAQWLDQDRLEPYFHGLLENRALGLARLLLHEAADQDAGMGPAQRAVVMLELAAKHPEILAGLMIELRWSPALLADLALYPPTAGLACLWIAKWTPPSSGWDQGLETADDQTGKVTAFTDAVWLFGEFLKQGKTDPAEAADLLIWFHDNVGAGYLRDAAETLLASLRDILAQQSADVANAILAALVVRLAETDDTGGASFSAILDMVSLCQLEDVTDPAPILAAYKAAIDKSDYNLSARRIGTLSAAALFRLARRSGGEASFLHPIDVAQRLADGKARRDNDYTVAQDVARALRTHIRVLARAITGLGKDSPANLAKALCAAVGTGARTVHATGEVGALAARFEANPHGNDKQDRPLANDLAAALRILPATDKDALLAAILKTNEPLILAQLHNLVPIADREKLRARIEALGPEVVGETWSHNETQARINALLNAGVSSAAQRYIDFEAKLPNVHKLGDFSGLRLQWQLRLHLSKGNFDAILATPEPQTASAMEQGPARATLQFFKAIATLLKPGGDAQVAGVMFRDLFQKHHLYAYATNILAAEVAATLEGDAFPLLSGAKERRARDALIEMDRNAADAGTPTPADVEIVALNRSILLLALGEAENALAVLGTIPSEERGDVVVGYRAVALARVGRTSEAKASVTEAKTLYGDTTLLRQAEAFIETGSAQNAAIHVVLDDTLRQQIKMAIAQLKLFDPLAQAELLEMGPDPFYTLLLKTLRNAGASLVALVPTLHRARKEIKEDDLNTLMREFIQSRVEILEWNVRDKTEEGWSERGNPGIPDLLIKKSSSTLATFEGVICDKPSHQKGVRDNLRSHYLKLLSYSTGQYFFHVTYDFTGKQQEILNYLRVCAEDPPDGFAFERHDEINQAGTLPRGLVTRYRRDSQDIAVIFLVLDTGQVTQSGAAAQAGTS